MKYSNRYQNWKQVLETPEFHDWLQLQNFMANYEKLLI